MPLYDYRCGHCGEEFSQLMPMARCSEAVPCRLCAQAAQRVISAPHLNTMRADMRSAHQINERSAHQPRQMQAHRCGAGCSHHSENDKPQLKQAGSAKRPWMIGH